MERSLQNDLLNLQSGVELQSLVGLFHRSLGELGKLDEVASGTLEEPFSHLLDHNAHMTVTVEAHHGCPVDVKVLDIRHDDDFYSRKILLTRQSDGVVVQYGIVTIDKRAIATHVFEEIMAQQTPLGRILINHDVLREVKLNQLFSITAENELARCLSVEAGEQVAGRTAMIECDGVPAIAVLEIVTR